MGASPKILAFAGSTRKESFNKKLVRLAADAARKAGGNLTLMDLKDLPLPLFDQDLEEQQGRPDNAARLAELMASHDAFLIAAPEYNSSITAVLKNAIDWASRPVEGQPPLFAFRGKIAALMAASPGALGGLRGLVHVRAILGNIGVIVLPDQVAVPQAHEAFDSQGALKDAKLAAKVKSLAESLVETTRRLSAN